MIVDIHCHLHMDYYKKDREQVIARLIEDECRLLLTVGIDAEDSKKAVSLASAQSFIFASVGIHPHDAVKCNDEALKVLEELAKHQKVVAIGEIGLDFYRNLSPREKQFEAFEQQLELAKKLNMSVVIHTRDAHEETKEVLKKYPDVRGVIHCFSGTEQDAKDYLDLGYMISFAGHTTYPPNEALREASEFVPLDMLLVETDAPFLTPVPLRGKRNEPSFVKYTAEVIAKRKGIKVEDLFSAVLENAKALFGVDI
ncbi:TatD DNase family protein [Thermosulfidibacter takaii ABI70S6]|uniref:TatD DNase family protein n=1 Tax=Thermosulfidibacter takaii (strain DSM 17441 / JCM 13301 / NBRC 103674 / ABI70S6) TaxID=1298851 RepID=A0A0S3QSD6_THET7|nr:TatD family hydrolase [Thermosulfidibacter takaii]BAT71237.1 TatD DNase family protein [Thermosulfidibacter takaii ABI70S6]